MHHGYPEISQISRISNNYSSLGLCSSPGLNLHPGGTSALVKNSIPVLPKCDGIKASQKYPIYEYGHKKVNEWLVGIVHKLGALRCC